MSNNQLSVRESKVMDAFELENVKTQLQSLLENNPKQVEAFKTRILKISLNYGLDKCSPESIIKCGIQALTLRLPLEAGQGYIVNYGGQAVFDCGYKGWQVLAKRAGLSVQADVVYSCDEFSQEGFGFDREIIFSPNYALRQSANDKWAKENLTGVIVSVMENETELKTIKFIPADMIHKIVGVSPSQQSDKGKKFSPHENWSEQMFVAKAIKQVLSKHAVDLEEAADLQKAVEYINETESVSQAQAKSDVMPEYPQERFDENYPKWKELVSNGSKPAMAIITQLSNSFKLSADQLSSVMNLRDCEPIEAEATNA